MGGCILEKGIEGNGKVVKEDREVSGFTSLKISSAFDVFLFQGSQEALTIEADENLIPHIKTEIKGDMLRIYTDENIRDYKKMNIYLTFEELEMIDISGAVSISAEDLLNFDELKLEGSGASEIDLEMEVKLLKADFSGASEIDLKGSAKSATFDLSGASDIDALDFEIGDLTLDVSGASDAKVYVTGNLEVDASGASSVRYKGSPHVQSDVSGAGSVKPY